MEKLKLSTKIKRFVAIFPFILILGSLYITLSLVQSKPFQIAIDFMESSPEITKLTGGVEKYRLGYGSWNPGGSRGHGFVSGSSHLGIIVHGEEKDLTLHFILTDDSLGVWTIEDWDYELKN